jgi:hypothetical protein
MPPIALAKSATSGHRPSTRDAPTSTSRHQVPSTSAEPRAIARPFRHLPARPRCTMNTEAAPAIGIEPTQPSRKPQAVAVIMGH